MRSFLTVLTLMLALACTQATAQSRKRANSKRATTVDSISAPPRMDGNTGRYDTVEGIRHRQKGKGKKGGGTDYHYRIGSDTIGARPKGRP